MGLFQSKQHANQQSPVDDGVAAAQAAFDETFREELRSYGREHFKQIIDETATVYKQDLVALTTDVGVELKQYMTKQLDATIAQVDTAMGTRLDERLAESDRATKDVQDMVVQSLNRNAQALHEKYQQLAQTFQQTVTSQEAMMITVFEENKARMTATQGAQETILQSLKGSAQVAQQQSQQVSDAMQKTIAEQQALLTTVFEDTMVRVAATRDAQDTALQTLNQSAQALQQQADRLGATLQQTMIDQKTTMTNAFQGNMAQIIEHYLLGALGDQYDMKAQLPSIIQQMEQNKQAIVDDMKL